MTQFIIPICSDVISAIVVAVLTIFITKFFNNRNEWLDLRSELIAYHDHLRKMIVDLADNPSNYNHLHFIAYFENELLYLCNISDKTTRWHKKEILKRVSDHIGIGFKEILLNADNETVLNVDGKKIPDKYGTFILQVDNLLSNANRIILDR